MIVRAALIVLLLVPLLWGAAGSETADATAPGAFRTTTGPAGIVADWLAAAGPVDIPFLGRVAAPGPTTDAWSQPGVTVHEWGTFTSVAGRDGRAVQWLPAGGPTDLPCFVALLNASSVKRWADAELGGRANTGTIRMETPVLYFYSDSEQSVDVKIRFPQGAITEWYPDANVSPLLAPTQKLQDIAGTIEWKNVKIMPGADVSFPVEAGPSHYYPARQTEAAPVMVGSQYEKFLFYRGIASFEPPIAARAGDDGDIAVTNLGEREIPVVVLFENRNGKVGYRIHEGLAAASGSVELGAPDLTADIDQLYAELEHMLQEHGMYPMEARAMVETWKDSWFEQGTRIFYIVPPATVDEILPLEISPRPVEVARAFVGLVEVITPATLEEVQTAIRNNDKTALAIYGRYLQPILDQFLDGRLSEPERLQAMGLMAALRAEYAAAVTACDRKPAW